MSYTSFDSFRTLHSIISLKCTHKIKYLERTVSNENCLLVSKDFSGQRSIRLQHMKNKTDHPTNVPKGYNSHKHKPIIRLKIVEPFECQTSESFG